MYVNVINNESCLFFVLWIPSSVMFSFKLYISIISMIIIIILCLMLEMIILMNVESE